MGCHHPKIFPILITIFIIISLYCTHILIVGVGTFNAAEHLNGQGKGEMFYMVQSMNLREQYIEKVSGEDENEIKVSLFLERFRVLLGLRSFHKVKDEYENGLLPPSPSPAPSNPSEAPAPSPALHIHKHYHPSKHHHHLMKAAHKVEKRSKGKAEKIIVAAAVSAAVTFLFCAAGLFFGCKRLKKHRKKSARGMQFFRGNKCASSLNSSVKKISSDPGPDLFYLDSLGVAFESEPLSLKENSQILSTCPGQKTKNCVFDECEYSIDETIKQEPESDNSSAGEITFVDETAEPKDNGAGDYHIISVDRIIPEEEEHTSDDESFHSFSDSASAKIRLSNASAASFYSDTAEILSPKLISSQNSFQDSAPVSIPLLNSESYPQPEQMATSSPKPPPPPPPPLILPSNSNTFTLRKMTQKTLGSTTLPNVSINSRSDSHQTAQCGSPPSQPSRGVPSPPCLTNGKTSSLKGPPPPPPQFSQYPVFDRDGVPLTKLKPLHWDKVRAAPDRSTVWDKLRSSSFEFDEEMIKSLFGYNLQTSMKNDEVKGKTPSPNKHVLEPKRLQNITILSKALNLTSEQICDALIRGNGLALQELEALAKMMPTKEEEAKLSDYKGDINELGSAEKFVKAMLKIPFAFSRIEAMLYRETFDDEVVHLRKSFSMLEEACKELRSSRLFLKLLEAVLKTGNRMNVGTIRGGARAFKLDALLKLSDVKATDGKTTLLHFVVQEIIRSEGFRVSESIMGKINQRSNSGNIEDKEEDYKRMGLELVSGLGTELCNVKKTATLDLDILASSVSNLSEGMKKIHQLVNKDMSAEERNGSFAHSIRSFITYAERNLKELQVDENRVLLHVREITEYFHGNVSKEESNPLRIFVIVRDFLCMLDLVCKELRNLKTPASPNLLAPFR